MKFGTLAAAAVLAAGLTGGAADAGTLKGTFNIDIYNFAPAGNETERRDNSAATLLNLGEQSILATITYTGALDFEIDLPQAQSTSTILDFLNTGGGTITGDTSGLNVILSSASFARASFFDITANFANGFYGSIFHDDGITLLDDAAVVASSAPPTVETETAYAFNGGEFRLIYAAANGNPSVLNVQAVPLPAGLALMLGALGCLGFVGRRRLAA